MANYKKIIEKRHRDEEATAYAFQEFLDTFQNVAPTGKTFIKSGVYNPGNSEETHQDDKGKLYNPTPVVKLPSQENNKKAIECARLLKENKFDKTKSMKPKSNLELLKEELRLRHLDRDQRHKQKSCETYSLSDSIDSTTNLFLTNLSPKLNEQDLMQIFGVYGPLASVKIMWPRAEDRVRNSNIGFVAFMSRKDSERAFSNLGNRDDMRVSWGKPIEIPTQPIYIPPEIVKMMLPPPYSGLPFNAQPLKKSYKIPDNEVQMQELLYNSIVKVTIPLDKKMLMLIHRVIEFVIREGPMFEAMLMHREISNPSFQFLFDNKSATHVYYRWKLFSIMNGESNMNWNPKPFRMFSGGSIWIPPTIPDYTKGMADYKTPKNEMQNLSENQQNRLIQLLQNLNLTRHKIMDAMIFVLKHAEAAKDITNIITESFQNTQTGPTKKVSRLYLVSDILYNTKFKKIPFKHYHELFEKRLVKVFEQLEQTHKSLVLVGDKNALKSRVLKVLRAWEMWRVYPGDFLDKLESTFLGESCDDSGNDEPLDGKILLTRSKNCAGQPDVKVLKIDPKKQEEEIDNYENFIPSKWETLDPAEIESQAMSTQKLHDIEMTRLENERNQKEKTLEYEKLRKVELKVLKYQDELECGKRKLKKYKNIEEEVNEYRWKCIEKSKREAKIIETSPISTDSFSSDESSEKRKTRRKGKKERDHFKGRKKYRR